MTDKPLPRPRQATLSGGLIMIGSTLIVLLAFQQVATLGSIEAQESAQDLVSSPIGDGLGLGVDDVQTLFRVLAFVAAAAGTAAAILGWQVLQRVRSARLALSVIAPVLLVSVLAAPGRSSAALVAAAVVMLWVQPTKDWFDGRAPAARPTPPAVAGTASYPPPTGRPAGTGAMPPPEQTQSSWNLAPPFPQAAQAPVAYAAPSTGRPPSGLPGQVTTGCIVAIVSSGVTLAFSIAALLALTLGRAEMIDAIEESDSSSFDGYSSQTVVDTAVVVFAVLLVWSLIAIGLAIAAMARSNAARIALVVSSVGAAFVCLLGLVTVIFIPVMVVTVVQLLRPESRDWFTAPR